MIKVQKLEKSSRIRKNEEFSGGRYYRTTAGDRTYDPSRVYPNFVGETIYENLNNRKQRPQTILKPLVEAALEEAGIKFTKLRWSQKAGCRMCPCSPGFIIEGHDGQDFFIDVIEDDTDYQPRPGL